MRTRNLKTNMTTILNVISYYWDNNIHPDNEMKLTFQSLGTFGCAPFEIYQVADKYNIPIDERFQDGIDIESTAGALIINESHILTIKTLS